jgi:hypothetical protein
MANRCSICSHPNRTEVEQKLLLGDKYGGIADEFRLSVSSLRRHRAHIVVLDGAVETIRAKASEGWTQNRIAAELGLPRQRFQALLKARRDWELSWQAGSAAHEQHLSELLEACAEPKSGRNPIPIMFALKARYGWVEAQHAQAPPPAPNVVVMLPGAMAPEAYLKMVKSRQLPVQQKGLP